SFNIPMTVTVRNTGNVALTNLQVTDDLTATFPAPSTFSIVGTPTLSAGLTAPAVAFDGITNQNLLSGNDTLAIGAGGTIDFTVRLAPNGAFGPFTNTAIATATPPTGPDVTVSSTTPPITLPLNPALRVTKTAGTVVDNGDGTFDVPTTITVRNIGNV